MMPVCNSGCYADSAYQLRLRVFLSHKMEDHRWGRFLTVSDAKHPSLSRIQGLNRLPYSFYPHVGAITTMDRMIERAEFLPKTNQVQLSWKNNFTDVEFQNATYDYAMITAPFSKVRSWRFPNTCMSYVTSDKGLSC